MSTYHVKMLSGGYEEVNADWFGFREGGVLVFYVDEVVILAYSANQWVEVSADGNPTA